MLRPFKRFLDFMNHLRGFFKSYDEEVLMGIDIERLIKDPDKDEKIDNLLAELDHTIEGLKDRYTSFMNEFMTIDRIYNLPKDLALKLQKLCRQYSETGVSMDEAQGRKSVNSDEEYPNIYKYRQQIPKAISILKEHEGNQQIVKNDINMLEGEKEELLYQFRNLNRALAFFKGFMIFLVSITMIVGIVLSVMLVFYEQPIVIPALISIVLIAFLFVWTFVFRRYSIHELKKNQILQERAVKLLNKIKIKYIHNQQVLEYEYKKYGVNSSEVLEMRYENYLNAVDQRRNMDAINRSLRDLVVEIDKLLTRSHIDNSEFVTQNAEYFSTFKGTAQLRGRYEEERQLIQNELKRCEHDKTILQRL